MAPTSALVSCVSGREPLSPALLWSLLRPRRENSKLMLMPSHLWDSGRDLHRKVGDIKGFFLRE